MNIYMDPSSFEIDNLFTSNEASTLNIYHLVESNVYFTHLDNDTITTSIFPFTIDDIPSYYQITIHRKYLGFDYYVEIEECVKSYDGGINGYKVLKTVELELNKYSYRDGYLFII